MDSPLKIILVEDEFLIAMTLEKELTRAGFQVIDSVGKGEEAVESVKQHLPDIILMDILLAGEIDGIETSKQILSFSAIPIIFMTGYSNPETVERAKALNPIGYLHKPVYVRDIVSIVELFFADT